MKQAVESPDVGSVDIEALAQRYAEERVKRLKEAGNAQYVPVEGALKRFQSDPWATRSAARAAVTLEPDVLIIGGGFAGQLAAVELRKKGVEDFRIVDVAEDFGGTWYWNRYPGAQCDIESLVYLPLLEDLGYTPTERYTHGPEIFAHARAIGRHFDLYDRALFKTEVTAVTWDDAAKRWVVETDHADTLRARYVVMAVGTLHRPKLPGIEGLETFAGHTFHTSRWDYAYTGGSPEGGMTGLADKRVGIIGTGCTAVQAIPYLAESCERLFVFQRTPSAVGPRGNGPVEPDWVTRQRSGWHRHRMENFNNLMIGVQQDEDLVGDGWTALTRRMGTLTAVKGETRETSELRQLADYQQMEEARALVGATVTDPATAEALKPWYNQFCKRPTFNDGYLPSFNRANVSLIDTRGAGVERITPTGVVVAGTEYALDCLIFATGFEMNTDYRYRAGYDVIGRDGITLSDKWKDGVRSLRGIHHHNFPNCFILGNSQSSSTPNYLHMISEVCEHVAYVIDRSLKIGEHVVEPVEDHENAWVDEMLSFAEPMRSYIESCTPGFYNNEGKFSHKAILDGFWGGGPPLSPMFIHRMRAWRADDGFEGLAFT